MKPFIELINFKNMSSTNYVLRIQLMYELGDDNQWTDNILNKIDIFPAFMEYKVWGGKQRVINKYLQYVYICVCVCVCIYIYIYIF